MALWLAFRDQINRTRFGRAIYRVLYELIMGEMVIHAGYAAYTTLLALFPFIIFLMSLAGWLGTSETAEKLIMWGFAFLPVEIVDTLAPVIRHIINRESGTALTLALAGTLWVASSGIEGIRYGLNHIYRQHEPRPLWKRRVQGFILVIVGGFLPLIMAFLIVLWPVFMDFTDRYFPWITHWDIPVINIGRYLLVLIVLTLAINIFYYFLPHRRLSWTRNMAGALLAAILWLLMATGFSFYLSQAGSYDASYGSLAGIIITMIFFHFSVLVLFIGAAFNVAYYHRKFEPEVND